MSKKDNNFGLALLALPTAALVAGGMTFALAWWTAIPATWMWNYHIGPALGMKAVTWQLMAALLFLRSVCGSSHPADYAKRETDASEKIAHFVIKLGYPWLAYVIVRWML